MVASSSRLEVCSVFGGAWVATARRWSTAARRCRRTWTEVPWLSYLAVAESGLDWSDGDANGFVGMRTTSGYQIWLRIIGKVPTWWFSARGSREVEEGKRIVERRLEPKKRKRRREDGVGGKVVVVPPLTPKRERRRRRKERKERGVVRRKKRGGRLLCVWGLLRGVSVGGCERWSPQCVTVTG